MTCSVLISIYREEIPEYFQRAMQSIWGDQKQKPGQIVLVKDGVLTSELDSVLKYWEDCLGDLLTVVSLPENVGLGGALNVGLKYCRYELVARMDSDDMALPLRFERQVEQFLSNPELDVVGSYSIEIDNAGNQGGVRIMPVTHESIVSSLWACPFIHPAVMFRKSSVLKAGGYNPSLRRRQDYELWFRCACHGMRFYNIPEPMILYRFHKKTHGKQSPRLAFQQALIGYRGSSLVGLAWWKRVACFIPFVRSFFPYRLQHLIYYAMRALYPRHASRGL